VVTSTRRLVATLATVLVAGLALAGCGSDGGADAAPQTTTRTEPGTAKIVAFEVPESTVCPEAATFTTVAVSYETAGAAKAELRVDGRPIPLNDPAGGTVDADIRCDPFPHDFVLIAYDADELLTVEQRLLNTTR